MHGSQSHTPDRVCTCEGLRELGILACHNYDQVAKDLTHNNFAYMPLKAISMPLSEMIALKPILGLRSPIHSLARMLNPLDASAMMVGIFHRGFMDIHASAATVMKQNNFTVFRGEGGEAERRPEKTCEVWSTCNNEIVKKRWSAILPTPQNTDLAMNIAKLPAFWRGGIFSTYGQAAVAGTLAIALQTMEPAKTMEDVWRKAQSMWERRNKNAFPARQP